MGLTSTLAGMLVARVMLGIGVSALPTATRAMSDWMPARKRGFGQGITHSFARIGNAVTPPLVAWLIALVLWRGAFILVGPLGVFWAILVGLDFPHYTSEEP